MATGVRRKSLSTPDLRFKEEQLNRLMQFVRELATEVQAFQQMLRGGSSGQVLEKTTGNDYAATWGDAQGQAVTGGENAGAGTGLVFKDLEGATLVFRTLVQGAGVVLTVDGTTITISAPSSGGGGGGTVTAVGISSADLDVSGSPVETAGDIELEIKAGAVTYPKMQETTQDSVVLGRRAGEGLGTIEELSAADLLAIIGTVNSGYPPQLGYAGI